MIAYVHFCFLTSGFGLTDTEDVSIYDLPEKLLEVDIKYVSEAKCRLSYGDVIDSSMICAIEQDQDACR
jgi:hypothetical protein